MVRLPSAQRLMRARARSRLRLAALVVLVAVLVAGVIVVVRRPLLADDFNRPNGLVTNEFSYFNPGNQTAVRSPIWTVTSGSLFVHGNAGWTGIPDRTLPNARSTNGTDSSVFRLVTSRSDFANVTVSFKLKVQDFPNASSSQTPGWQGVHVFMRYQSPDLLYVVSVDREDGVVVIKKKVPGGPVNGGTYYTLASAKGTAVQGRWEQIQVSAVNNGEEGVKLKLWLDGRLKVTGVDNGVGGAPIIQPGRVGIRGDYAQFLFDDFTVRKA